MPIASCPNVAALREFRVFTVWHDTPFRISRSLRLSRFCGRFPGEEKRRETEELMREIDKSREIEFTSSAYFGVRDYRVYLFSVVRFSTSPWSQPIVLMLHVVVFLDLFSPPSLSCLMLRTNEFYQKKKNPQKKNSF